MKTNLKNVYTKLPNQITSLKSNKVELNLTFDLATVGSTTEVLINQIDEDLFEIERYKIEIEQVENELQSDLSDLINKTDELEKILIDTEELAKELGVDPGSITNFENALEIYESASDKIVEINKYQYIN